MRVGGEGDVERHRGIGLLTVLQPDARQHHPAARLRWREAQRRVEVMPDDGQDSRQVGVGKPRGIGKGLSEIGCVHMRASPIENRECRSLGVDRAQRDRRRSGAPQSRSARSPLCRAEG